MTKKITALLFSVFIIVSVFASCGKETKPSETSTAPISEAPVSETSADTDIENTDTPATEPESVFLTVWVSEDHVIGSTIQAMCESFKGLHPEWRIDFNFDVVENDILKDEVLHDISAAADVYHYSASQTADLAAENAIAKLNGTTAQMIHDTMDEPVYSTTTIDGDLYGIPISHNTFFMYYDKTLLLEENIKSMESIMGKETRDNVFNFMFDSAGGYKFASWYYGAGLTIYGEDQVTFAEGTNWNNETGLAVTNYLVDLISNDKSAYADDHDISELISEHRLGAWFGDALNYHIYKSILEDDLGVAVLPTFNPNGNDYQLKGFYNANAIGVNPQSKYLEAAEALAAYLGGEEMQLKRFHETAQIPTNKALANEEDVKNDPVATVLIQEAAIASVAQPTSFEFNSAYWGTADHLALEMNNGTLTKENAQEYLDAFVEEMAVE